MKNLERLYIARHAKFDIGDLVRVKNSSIAGAVTKVRVTSDDIEYQLSGEKHWTPECLIHQPFFWRKYNKPVRKTFGAV